MCPAPLRPALYARIKIGMSTDNARKKSRMGRPPVDSEELRARVRRHVVDALDAYAAQQPEPKPSRPEMIRKILEDRLVHEGLIKPD